MSIWRLAALVGAAWGLSACSSSPDTRFLSTGYVADQGIVRIWRKDDRYHQPQAVMSVYTPLHGKDTVVSRYEYRDGRLALVRQMFGGSGQVSLLLRFDEKGEVSFMQRQLDGRKEALSPDDIARSQFMARHMVEMSDALQVGKVYLHQGRWSNGVYTSCAGVPQKLALEAWQQAWIVRRAAETAMPLGIAWLEAPEGAQLLLVANENFCSWQPTEKSL